MFDLLKDKYILSKESYERGYTQAKKEDMEFLRKREDILKKESKFQLDLQKYRFLNRLKIAEKEKKAVFKKANDIRKKAEKAKKELDELSVYFLNTVSNLQNYSYLRLKRNSEDMASIEKVKSEFESLRRLFDKKQKQVNNLLGMGNDSNSFDVKYLKYEENEDE
jgi:seryl-tRNA synthetase